MEFLHFDTLIFPIHKNNRKLLFGEIGKEIRILCNIGCALVPADKVIPFPCRILRNGSIGAVHHSLCADHRAVPVVELYGMRCFRRRNFVHFNQVCRALDSDCNGIIAGFYRRFITQFKGKRVGAVFPNNGLSDIFVGVVRSTGIAVHIEGNLLTSKGGVYLFANGILLATVVFSTGRIAFITICRSGFHLLGRGSRYRSVCPIGPVFPTIEIINVLVGSVIVLRLGAALISLVAGIPAVIEPISAGTALRTCRPSIKISTAAAGLFVPLKCRIVAVKAMIGAAGVIGGAKCMIASAPFVEMVVYILPARAVYRNRLGAQQRSFSRFIVIGGHNGILIAGL